MSSRTVPAANFVGTLAENVDNDRLSDKEFRQFVRNSLPVVIYDAKRYPPVPTYKKKPKAKSKMVNTHDSNDERVGGFA